MESSNINPNQKQNSTKKKADEKQQSWREHKNPVVRYFAKFSYTVWLVVMVVGVSLALIIALALL